MLEPFIWITLIMIVLTIVFFLTTRLVSPSTKDRITSRFNTLKLKTRTTVSNIYSKIYEGYPKLTKEIMRCWRCVWKTDSSDMSDYLVLLKALFFMILWFPSLYQWSTKYADILAPLSMTFSAALAFVLLTFIHKTSWKSIRIVGYLILLIISVWLKQ